MELSYKVTFLDYWHIGSGLSAGARSDSTVLRDEAGLPYLPGKTLKGLAREAAESICDTVFVEKYFGKEGVDMAQAYFTNAVLPKGESEEIMTYKLQNSLYTTVASTQIGENGVAVDDSLREIEVVIPLGLEGKVLDIESQEEKVQMLKVLKMIKRMGLNRNRGLGRCKIEEVTS